MELANKRKVDEDDEKKTDVLKRIKSENSTNPIADALLKNGVAVVDCTAYGPFVHDFDAALHGMPEFKQNPDGYVMGGFAALGNPSSFHNPFVRKARAMLHVQAAAVFQAYASQASLPRGTHLEQLMDRMLFRPAGKVPTKESWHRDQSPVDEDDRVFGGWLNCDPIGADPQVFSCVLGTHNDKRGPKGFAKIDKTVARRERYDQRCTQVAVPPGHWIVFHQNIVHEVNAVRRDSPQRRVFAGWRLTVSDQPLFGEILRVCTNQGVPRLPSGQKVPMYAALHWTYERNRKLLLDWSAAAIKPELLVQRELKGKTLTVVPRFMSSLKELGLAMYPEYSKEELALLRPTLL
jgi:hypothetical protein